MALRWGWWNLGTGSSAYVWALLGPLSKGDLGRADLVLKEKNPFKRWLVVAGVFHF